MRRNRQEQSESVSAGSLEIRAPGNARRRVRAGEKLFPGTAGPSFTGEPRSAATRDAQRQTGGAARSILEAGGSFAQLLEAARWRFSAFPLPLDFVVGDTEAMAPIPIAAPDDEGPGRREPGKDGAP